LQTESWGEIIHLRIVMTHLSAVMNGKINGNGKTLSLFINILLHSSEVIGSAWKFQYLQSFKYIHFWAFNCHLNM